MAVLKRQNVCFGTKYTDNAGQEKTRWVTVGKAFHSDRGGISIKFDTTLRAWGRLGAVVRRAGPESARRV